MAKIALVFPGQGSQQVGMGKDLYDNFPEAKAFFQRADEILKFSISRLCFQGPEEELRLTTNTQPAILLHSVAAFEVFKQNGIKYAYVAGHSLGEYSALVAAQALRFEDALQVVRQRGQFMQEAVPVGVGAMAAVFGMDKGALREVCHKAQNGQVVEAANFNAPGQIVIAGHKEAVGRAIELAKQAGAKRAVPLPVSAPFHCSLMKPAQERLGKVLKEISLNDPRVPLITNVDADFVNKGTMICGTLERQVSNPVRWDESMEKLKNHGVDTFIEIGPGKVLSGLIRRIVTEAQIYNIEDRASLEATIKAITG
jgi:[acyl-carrier-protein] S-malonyltransferase